MLLQMLGLVFVCDLLVFGLGGFCCLICVLVAVWFGLMFDLGVFGVWICLDVLFGCCCWIWFGC